MPELPEVESVRRQLEPELSGRRVLAVWADTQRRFHAPDRLLGRRVEAVGRRGKFLLWPLDQGLELVLHLGMTGVLHFGVADAYVRARIALDDGRELLFRDVRRLVLGDRAGARPIALGLGWGLVGRLDHDDCWLRG